MSYDYQKLEAELLQLLMDFGDAMTPNEISEVRRFLDAGEYGVAFETLCSIIKEEQKPVPASIGTRLRQLGERMGLDPDCWSGL